MTQTNQKKQTLTNALLLTGTIATGVATAIILSKKEYRDQASKFATSVLSKAKEYMAQVDAQQLKQLARHNQ